MAIRRALTVVLSVMLGAACARATAAAERARRWTLEGQGITFEMTRTDLRAWTGDTSALPAFSMAAILAGEKKRFDDYAKELARELEGPEAHELPDYLMTSRVTFEVLSVVGPLVSYRDTGGGDTPGTPHPSGWDTLNTRDVRRKDAKVSLLDFWPEKQVVAALRADPFIGRFGNPEKGYESAATLKELVDALDPEWARENSEAPDNDCGFDVFFGTDMVEAFYFHHLEKDKVAVRFAVAPGNEMCARVAGLQQVGLLLPIPEALRDDLLAAARGRAGFLAARRKTAGSPSYGDGWEVDIRTLTPKRK